MFERVSVLVVCRHNICRSPLAEAILRHAFVDAGIKRKVKVVSAGTHTTPGAGERTDDRSVIVAKRQGLKMKPKPARALKDRDFAVFDYILAMDESNLVDLKERCPHEFQHKLGLYLSFDQHGGFPTTDTGATLGDENSTQEVPDPYYGSVKGFEHVYQLLHRGAVNIVRNIRESGLI